MGSHPKRLKDIKRLFKSIWMGYEMYQIYLNKTSKLRKNSRSSVLTKVIDIR